MGRVTRITRVSKQLDMCPGRTYILTAALHRPYALDAHLANAGDVARGGGPHESHNFEAAFG